MSKSKKPSRRAAQRRAAELVEAHRAADQLPAELKAKLDAYVPAGVDDDAWNIIRPVFDTVMTRSRITGTTSFTAHLNIVSKYLAYRHRKSMSIAIEDAFTQTAIDRYYLNGLDASAHTRNQYRSKLGRIAGKVNPSLSVPIEITTAGHQDIRPGYSDTEMAAIRRCATRQRSVRVRQQLCAIVGLCAGAGLSSTDLRRLTAAHITDHGDDGIEVEVPAGAPRTVWVRRAYEDLVRIGLEDVRANQLLVGTKENRKNVTTAVIASADLYDVPNLEACRLRSTWLTWLLTCRAPIKVILDAAGLKTARSLTDLIAQLPAVDIDAGCDLRGDAS